MYRKTKDFIEEWTTSAAGTLSVMRAIADDKMGVAIVEGHNSLGSLAWHLTGSAEFFGRMAGFRIPSPGSDMPDSIADIVKKYEEIAEAYKTEAAALTDEGMEEEVNGFAGPVARGKLLRSLIDHQTHHRGQMTVLLRQAGLTVPGVMGPTKEMQKA